MNLVGIAASRSEVLAELSGLFFMERRLAAGTQALLKAELDNMGLQHIIEAAYRLLKNPIFICDMSGKYTASVYDENSFAPDDPFAGFILDDILYNYLGDGGRAFIRKHKIDEILQKRTEPYPFFHQRFQCESIVSNIRIRNTPVGRILIVAIEHAFTEFDRRMFEILTSVLNQLMQRSNSLSVNQFDPASKCLADLVSTNFADETILARSTTLFHLKPDGRYHMAVSQPLDADRDSAGMGILAAQFKFSYPGFPAAILDQRLVALLPLEDENLAPGTLQSLEDFCKCFGLFLGLSNRFGELSRVRSEYLKAVRAADLGAHFRPERRVAPFKEMVVYDLLSDYQRGRRLSDLIVPEIWAILKSDEKNGGEYLNTLSAYMRCFGKSQKICEELHIHKNTLLYRLERLKDTFDLELDNGEAQLRYQLSLLILKMLDAQHHFLPEHIQL